MNQEERLDHTFRETDKPVEGYGRLVNLAREEPFSYRRGKLASVLHARNLQSRSKKTSKSITRSKKKSGNETNPSGAGHNKELEVDIVEPWGGASGLLAPTAGTEIDTPSTNKIDETRVEGTHDEPAGRD